jgi:transcriptional regulator with XRE-family HTH domain
METALIIWHNIKTIRTARGISQKELARRVGVPQAHISDIERNKRRASIPVLLKIMEALKCSPTDERQETAIKRENSFIPCIWHCKNALYSGAMTKQK